MILGEETSPEGVKRRIADQPRNDGPEFSLSMVGVERQRDPSFIRLRSRGFAYREVARAVVGGSSVRRAAPEARPLADEPLHDGIAKHLRRRGSVREPEEVEMREAQAARVAPRELAVGIVRDPLPRVENGLSPVRSHCS